MTRNRSRGKRKQNMTPTERRRLMRIRKKRQRERRRRQMTRLLFLIMLAVILLLLFKDKKGTGSVSSDSVPKNKAAVSEKASQRKSERAKEITDYSEEAEDNLPESGSETVSDGYAGIIPVSEVIDTSVSLNVIMGRAAVDLSAVSRNRIGRIHSAKAAMQKNSYFAGTSKSVDAYLSEYGMGTWHAFMGMDGDIRCFYEGSVTEIQTILSENKVPIEVKVLVPYKVKFTMYEDGSFYVTGAEKNEQQIEDYEEFLKNVVQGK